MDRIIDILYSNGFFIFYIFSALGFENLFLIINKECKRRWDEYFKNNPEMKGKILPSCNCDDIIPVLLMVPEYIEFDQKSVDKFNGYYWKNIEEYRKYYIEITPEDREKLIKGDLKKPKEIQPDSSKIALKIMTYTPPISKSIVPTFRKQLREMVVVCKKDHRVLVNSPAFSKSKKDKYDTVAQSFRYIQEELCVDPLFDRILRKKGGKMSKWQLSNNKIVILANEARAIFPSHKLSGDPESAESKRAGYNFMPERRHAKTWVFIDCQSPSDLFDGIRYQFSDVKIFKRTTRELIGEENHDFFEKIERICDNILISWGFDPKKPNQIPQSVNMRMLFEKKICRLTNIPDNYYCVKLANGDFQFRKVKHARFHHKQGQLDDWSQITGIKWKVMINKLSLDIEKENKSKPSAIKKEQKLLIFNKVAEFYNKSMSSDEILTELKKLVRDGVLPATGIENLTSKSLNNWFNRMRSKQA